MKIHALRGENMMRMKVFDLAFDDKGGTIIVSGKNGEGKTSLINSMVLALGGSKTDVSKLTTKKIREGEKSAWVEVEVGDYVVRRTWKSNDKDTVTITGRDGGKFPSPQTFLNKLIGDLSFDPLAFTRMEAKKQRELLLSIVDLPIDLEKHEAKRKEIFERRRDIGRERDRLEGAMNSAPDFLEGTPDEEVSLSALIEDLRSANEANKKLDQKRERHAFVRAEIERMEDQLRQYQEEEDELDAELESAPPRIDTEKMEETMRNAEDMNAAVRAKKSYNGLRAEFDEQAKKYDAGTAFLEKMDKEKADALAKAEMPIGGLSFDEDGVTFDGIPFSQLSMSQQIKVSTAIGMAQNPDIRVMMVRDGSLLDSDNMKALATMAEQNDFQIFVEVVDDAADVGIVVEDGEVVSGDSTAKG